MGGFTITNHKIKKKVSSLSHMKMDYMIQEQEQEKDQEQNSNGVYVTNKVMTDEQIEILRKQISVYTTLSHQLVQMHKQQQQQHLLLASSTDGIFYSDPSVALGHRISARQRWTPTPVQLQVLEQIFDQGNGTPTKQKIKEIADDLLKHGLISETNVYNWFQNRRARSKRKQLAAQPSSNNGQQVVAEVEVEVESSMQKHNTKPEIAQSSSSSFQNLLHTDDEHLYLEEYGTELHCDGDDHLFPLEEHHLSSSTSLYETSIPDSKLCFYQPGDQFHMLG